MGLHLGGVAYINSVHFEYPIPSLQDTLSVSGEVSHFYNNSIIIRLLAVYLSLDDPSVFGTCTFIKIIPHTVDWEIFVVSMNHEINYPFVYTNVCDKGRQPRKVNTAKFSRIK